MKLFYTKSSPYANCVRMVITELGIGDQVEWVESPPFANDSEFQQANPLGKVPCLVEGDEAIIDSEVICDYLDANFTGGVLFNPIYADWKLKSLLALVRGLIDVCVGLRIEKMREDEGVKSQFWWERYSKAIQRTLTQLESQLKLLPPELSILHIYLFSALAYLDFRHADIHWRTEFPQLAEFFAINQNRSCFLHNPFSA